MRSARLPVARIESGIHAAFATSMKEILPCRRKLNRYAWARRSIFGWLTGCRDPRQWRDEFVRQKYSDNWSPANDSQKLCRNREPLDIELFGDDWLEWTGGKSPAPGPPGSTSR